MLKGVTSIATVIIFSGLVFVTVQTFELEKKLKINRTTEQAKNNSGEKTNKTKDNIVAVRELQDRLTKLKIRFEKLEASFKTFQQTEEERLLTAQQQFATFNLENNTQIQKLKDYVQSLPEDITSLLNLDENAIKKLTKIITSEQKKKMLYGLLGETFYKEFEKLLKDIQIEEEKKAILKKEYNDAFVRLAKNAAKVLQGDVPVIFLQAFVNKFNKEVKSSFQNNLTTEQYDKFKQNWEKSFLKRFDAEPKRKPEDNKEE